MKFLALLITLVLLSATVFSLSITSLEIKEGSSVLNGTIVNKNSADITLVLTTDGVDNNKVCFTYSTTQPASCANYINFTTSPMTITLSDYDSSLWTNDRNNSVFAVLWDGNTLASNYAYFGAWAIDDNSGPTLGTTYPVASTDYNIKNFDFSLAFSDTYSSVTGISVSVDSNLQVSTTTSPATFSMTGLAEGSHTVSYDTNDSQGNIRTGSFTFTVDTNAPKNGTISYSGWTNSDKPTISLSTTHTGTGVLIRFSCNNSNWTSWVAYATTYSDFNINDTTYGCTARTDWNKSIYVQFKDAVENVDTNVYRAYILYDITAPSPPTSLTVSAGNATANLNWTAPTTADNNSTNAGYNIYRATGSGAFESIASITGSTTISYTATGLTNGTTYKFKVYTRDGAGNLSSATSEVSVTPEATSSALTVKKSGITADYVKNADIVTAECVFTQNTTTGKIFYSYLNPSGTTTQLKAVTTSVNVITESLTINSGTTGYEKISFWCESGGVAVSSIIYVNIDNTLPTITWNDTNNTASGTKRVEVTAADNKLIDRVEFDFNGSILSSNYDTTKTNTYYIDLNTVKYDNSTKTLKSRAFDKAGNYKEITRDVNISNISPIKTQAASKIAEATAKKTEAEKVINNAKSLGLIISDSTKAKKTSADSALIEAKSNLETTPQTALTKATLANRLYDEFTSLTNFRDTNTATYSFDNANTEELITALGITPINAKMIAQYVNDSNIVRRLVMVETGDANIVQVKIEIEFTNDTNSDKVKIIEYIPKELIDSAKKIMMSSHTFTIIKDDPIIEFAIDITKGTKTTIRYGLGEMSKTSAKALLDSNVISKFMAPPLIVEGSMDTSKITQIPLFDGNTMMIIAIIIIIIILVVVIVFVIKFKGPGHGFGENKSIIAHLTPEKPPEPNKWEANKPMTK